MNNILYICGAMSNRMEEIRTNSRLNLTYSTNVFETGVINGFRQNNSKNVSILSLPSTQKYPKHYKKRYFNESVSDFNGNKWTIGGYSTLPVLQNIGIYSAAKRNITKWVKEDEKNRTVIFNKMSLNLMLAIKSVKKEYPNLKVCLFILDLPQFNNYKGIKSKIYALLTKTCYNLLKYVDSYILISEYMKDPLNIGEKPYMVLEGIYNITEESSKEELKAKEKVILYTGALHLKYGIKDLLDAFCKITDSDCRLWISGDGEAKSLVENYVATDNRIKYFGMLKQHEDVLVLQKKARILVNPSRPNEEFVKYNFPSKIIEYMASGTPVVMHNLQGVPNEYKKYLVLIPNNSVQSLYEAMNEWCEKPMAELQFFGNAAKNFIFENKNAKTQSQRIIDFLSNYKIDKNFSK